VAGKEVSGDKRGDVAFRAVICCWSVQ